MEIKLYDKSLAHILICGEGNLLLNWLILVSFMHFRQRDRFTGLSWELSWRVKRVWLPAETRKYLNYLKWSFVLVEMHSLIFIKYLLQHIFVTFDKQYSLWSNELLIHVKGIVYDNTKMIIHLTSGTFSQLFDDSITILWRLILLQHRLLYCRWL